MAKKFDAATMVFRIIGVLIVFSGLSVFLSMANNVMFSGIPARVLFDGTVLVNIVGFCCIGIIMFILSRWLAKIVIR